MRSPEDELIGKPEAIKRVLDGAKRNRNLKRIGQICTIVICIFGGSFVVWKLMGRADESLQSHDVHLAMEPIKAAEPVLAMDTDSGKKEMANANSENPGEVEAVHETNKNVIKETFEQGKIGQYDDPVGTIKTPIEDESIDDIETVWKLFKEGKIAEAEEIYGMERYRKYRLAHREAEIGFDPGAREELEKIALDLDAEDRFKLYCLAVGLEAAREANFWLRSEWGSNKKTKKIEQFIKWEMMEGMPDDVNMNDTHIMFIHLRNCVDHECAEGHPAGHTLSQFNSGAALYYASFALEGEARINVLKRLVKIRPGWIKGLRRADLFGIGPEADLDKITKDEGNSPYEIEQVEKNIGI